MVADEDVARFAGDLGGGFCKLDGRTVVFKDGGGADLGKTISIEEVAEVGHTAAATGEADVFCLHAGEGDTRVLRRRRARYGGR